VAPILEKGTTSIGVDFPKGDWYHYFSGKAFKGDQIADIEVQLETLPVFVKAGSLIPTVSPFKNMASYPNDSLFINYYFDPQLKESTYTLYEDNGKNARALETGRFSLTTFSVNPKAKKLKCESKTDSGSYKGQPTERKIVWRFYHVPETVKTITVNESLINTDTLRNHSKGYIEIITH